MNSKHLHMNVYNTCVYVLVQCTLYIRRHECRNMRENISRPSTHSRQYENTAEQTGTHTHPHVLHLLPTLHKLYFIKYGGK